MTLFRRNPANTESTPHIAGCTWEAQAGLPTCSPASTERPDEQGFALLLVIFILSLVSVLVLDFAQDVESFQRSSRGFTEQVQAALTLRSSMNLARLLLEAPKPEDTKDEDWLYEAWNNIGSVPAIPLEGIVGELRMMIVDDDGKIDLNSVVGPSFGSFPTAPATPQTPGVVDGPTFWRNALKKLLQDQGFQDQQLTGGFRTFGNQMYSPANQVAVLADWVDRDNESFHVPSFDGDGIESNSDRSWFFNRPLKSLGELGNVPGMTQDRIAQIAPFTHVSSTGGTGAVAVNINTAPGPVLEAMGLPEPQTILQRRLSAPYTRESLSLVTGGDQQIASRLKVNSSEFSAYARVIMPTKTFWAHAIITVQRTGANRKAQMRSIEFY